MKEVSIYNNNLKNVKDFILVSEIKNGKERAFNEIFDRYFDKVVYTLMKNNIVRIDEAQDIVSEAFLDFYEQVMNDKFKENGKMFSYIYLIAHRKYLKILGKNKEDIIDDDYLETLIKDVFEDDDDKEKYFDKIEIILKELSVGNIKCKILFDAQYGDPKIGDDDIYNKYIKAFSNQANVKNKRNKCLEKLKKEFSGKNKGKSNEK